MKTYNYDYINKLYYGWLNERDAIKKGKLKEKIKEEISSYDFLKFCETKFYMPLITFRKIFPLCDLFEALEYMKKQGENINIFTQYALQVNNPEDIQSINNFATRETSLNKNDFCFIFEGSMIFELGNLKSIGESFNHVYIDNLYLSQIEEMVKKKKKL